MSQKKRAARRQVHYCPVCDRRIPILLRTDRRTCSDVCRKWAQRHPGHKRVYLGRGTVPLPPRPGQGQPKTLAEALRLLAAHSTHRDHPVQFIVTAGSGAS